jgi:membrane protease YdiL (CAAX protease family)
MNTDSGIMNQDRPLPWGFWATIGFSFLIGVVVFLVHGAVAIAFVMAIKSLHPNIDLHELESSLKSNGLLLAIATLASTPFTILASILFAKLCGRLTAKEYFCLYNPGKREYIKWFLVMLVLAVCSDGLTVLLGKPIVPEFMVEAYKTAYFAPLLWLAVVVGAPLSEEFIFRGFVFKGIEHSRLGGAGAVVISSLGWAALHVQYDLYGIAIVFAGGILLGIARLKSQSLYIPIMMHAVWSAIASVEVAVM